MVRHHLGFSLIEVTVAFFITTVSVSIIFQIYAKGVTASMLANEYASALAIAESRLAEVSNDAEMRDLIKQGTEEDRYAWEITTEDYMIADHDAESTSSYSLVLVGVTVSWGNRGNSHQVDLQTLKPVIVE